MGSSNQNTAERDNLFHREIVRLAILIVLAVAAFFLTLELSASNRRNSLQVTADWYRHGEQQLDAGRAPANSVRRLFAQG